jgi:hypothetical protein
MNNIGGAVFQPALALGGGPNDQIGQSISAEITIDPASPFHWVVDVGISELTDPAASQGYQNHVRWYGSMSHPVSISASTGPFDFIGQSLAFRGSTGSISLSTQNPLRIVGIEFFWRTIAGTGSVLIVKGAALPTHGDSGAAVFTLEGNPNPTVVGIVMAGNQIDLVAIVPINVVLESVQRQIHHVRMERSSATVQSMSHTQ